MSYNVNLLNQYQQYPINYGAAQVDPAQVAGYAQAAVNNANDESKATDGLGLMSVFAVGSGVRKVSKYAKNTGSSVTDVMKTSFEATKNDAKNLVNIAKNGDKKAFTTYTTTNKLNSELFDLQASLPKAKKMEKMSAEAKALYEKAGKTLSKASKAKTLATKEKYIKEAKIILEQASEKSASKLTKVVSETTSKVAQTASKATKATKTIKTAETIAETAKVAETASKTLTTGSKLLKAIKGNALFLAVEGGIELFTNVVPTFKQLGAKSGMKQIGKSAVKVGASVGGWAAGAALGAAIGSVIPGAGTAVGAVVGGAISLISSLVCSTVATKVAKKIVGKDELELAAEKEQQKQQEQQAQVASVSNQQLMQQAGIVSPTSNTQTVNPFNYSNVSNPMLTSYVTQDNSDNLLMMPLRSGLQLTA